MYDYRLDIAKIPDYLHIGTHETFSQYSKTCKHKKSLWIQRLLYL